MINIKELNKAEVLKNLYNNSKIQGMGFLQARSGDMTTAQAEEILKETHDFDYLYGKVMKVNLSGDSFNPWLYDRDNGPGAAESALKPLMNHKG